MKLPDQFEDRKRTEIAGIYDKFGKHGDIEAHIDRADEKWVQLLGQLRAFEPLPLAMVLVAIIAGALLAGQRFDEVRLEISLCVVAIFGLGAFDGLSRIKNGPTEANRKQGSPEP